MASMNLNNGVAEVYFDEWTQFKPFVDGTMKSLSVQFVESSSTYQVSAFDGGYFYRVDLFKDGYQPGGWSSEQISKNDSGLADFEQNFKADGNKTLASDVMVKTEASDLPVFAPGPRPGIPQFLDCSHNWADKTTWHTNAAEKVGAALTHDATEDLGLGTKAYFLDDGQGSAVPFWICWGMKKIYREEIRHPERRVRVYDDGVEVVVAGFNETKESAGIDCEINFRSGAVIFASGYSVTGPVTADFFHIDQTLSPAEQSEFIMRPQASKRFVIERAEVQFTKGIEINDTGHFAAFGYLNYFAVQSDATLDPVLFSADGKLSAGMSFLITDAGNLHENFGVIPGLENGDVVSYIEDTGDHRPDGFVIWFDASENASGTAMNALAGSDPYPTVKTWNGSAWSAEGYGAPKKVEIPNTRISYPTFEAYLNDANGNYAVIPGGFTTGPRGCPHDILQFKYDWRGSKILSGHLAIEMRVWLENGGEFGGAGAGHFGTGTFYGQIQTTS